jgi:hypothetical protein
MTKRRRRDPPCAAQPAGVNPLSHQRSASTRRVAASTAAPKPVRQRGIGIVPKRPSDVQRGKGDDTHDVRQAREEEGRDRLAADLLGAHAAAVQRPCTQRQATRATDRQHGVRPLLRHPDLVAQPPAHPRAEDRAEDHDVTESREHLQPDAGDQPARRGVRHTVAQRAEPRAGEHGHHDDAADRSQLQQPAADAPRAQLIWHREARQAAPGPEAALRLSEPPGLEAAAQWCRRPSRSARRS